MSKGKVSDDLQATYSTRFRALPVEQQASVAIGLVGPLLELWDKAIINGGFVALGVNKFGNQLSVNLCKCDERVSVFSRALATIGPNITEALLYGDHGGEKDAII